MPTTRSKFYLPSHLTILSGGVALLGCGTKSITMPPDPEAIPARATVTASDQALPPSYVMKFEGLQLVVDANAVVQSSSTGNVVLQAANAAPQASEAWKIFDQTQQCCQSYSFADIDRLYKSGASIQSGDLGGPADLSIPWTRFGLLDQSLPSSRFLIVQRTSAAGLFAYQLFDVVFPAPQD